MSPEIDDDLFEDQRGWVDNPMRRLFAGYGRENTFELVVGVLANVVARVLDFMPPIILDLTIDATIRQETLFAAGFPVLLEAWITPYVPAIRSGQLLSAVGIIASNFTIGTVFHWLRNWGWNAYAQQTQHDARTDTYDRMQLLNMDFFADKQTGEMMSIFSDDVNRLEWFLNDGMNSFFHLFVMVITIAVILFSYNWQLVLVAPLPVPLIALFMWKFVGITQLRYADVRPSVGKLNSRLGNNLGGIQVVKTFGTEFHEFNRVDGVSMDYFDANWDAINTRIKFFPALRILVSIGFSLTLVVGSLWVINRQGPGPFTGDPEIGESVALILLTQQFIWSLVQFGQTTNTYQRAHASSARIFGLMDEPVRLAEQPDVPDLAVLEGRVEYDDVAFGHSDGETVVGDIPLEADGGETLALVGPTGGGKSTILKLLMRMYDPNEGHVSIDGQGMCGVITSSLRESIACASQETFLFYGTVCDNITYGTFDADDEAVVAAAKAAEAHESISNLLEGYDTKVGERGMKSSGSQRQRVSIAHVTPRDPDILALGEATLNVDTETEMLIQCLLDELAVDQMTFSIVHRLSIIKDAEQIAVLEDGRIAERGAHDDLLSEDGLYTHLQGVQAGETDQLPDGFVERVARWQAEVDAGGD